MVGLRRAAREAVEHAALGHALGLEMEKVSSQASRV